MLARTNAEGRVLLTEDKDFGDLAFSRPLPQLRLFALDEAGWPKALKLDGYAPRRPDDLARVLFPAQTPFEAAERAVARRLPTLAIPTADAVPVVGDISDAHGFRTPCLGTGGKSVALGPVTVRESAPRPPSSDWRMGTMAEIILFHSALGVRPGVTAAADRLRAAGHTVHVPDYYDGTGPIPGS